MSSPNLGHPPPKLCMCASYQCTFREQKQSMVNSIIKRKLLSKFQKSEQKQNKNPQQYLKLIPFLLKRKPSVFTYLFYKRILTICFSCWQETKQGNELQLKHKVFQLSMMESVTIKGTQCCSSIPQEAVRYCSQLSLKVV